MYKTVRQDQDSQKKNKENKGEAWATCLPGLGAHGLLNDHFKPSRWKKSDEDKCAKQIDKGRRILSHI